MTVVKIKHIIKVWDSKQLNLGDKVSKNNIFLLQKIVNK
jgi:hypothetical protein